MSAQIWSYEQKILAYDRDNDDSFGASLDIHGDLAIVGAPDEDHDTLGLNFKSNAGSAYIFKRDSANGWQILQKIVAGDRHTSDFFGFKTIIASDFAMVAAPQNEAVYVFEPDSSGHWRQTQKISGDDMGSELALRNDSTVAIGASRYGFSNQGNTGAVYIYKRNPGGFWTQAQLIISDSINGGRFFGTCIDFSNENLVVGAPWDSGSIGSATIFTEDSLGHWSVFQKLTPANNSNNGYFGNDIAVNEKLLVIAQSQYAQNSFLLGAVYIYKKDSTGSFQEIQWLIPNPSNQIGGFGKEVVINGNQILIGAPNSKNPGLVIVYDYNSSSGMFEETQRLIASDPGFAGGFGAACAVNQNQLVVNRYFDYVPAISGTGTLQYAGSVYFYDLCKTRFDSIIVNSCGTYISPSGKVWPYSGIYSDTLLSQAGCDSVVNINLTVNQEYTAVDSITVCSSFNSPSGKYIWTSSGIYRDTLMSVAGCDSIVAINLEVLQNDTILKVETCYSYTAPSGLVLTSSGVYHDTLTNQQGCDSILSIDLTVYNDGYSSLDTGSCYSFISPSGNLISSSGIFIDTIQSRHGCDSIITLNLTIDSIDTVVEYVNGVLAAKQDSVTYQWLICDSSFAEIPGAESRQFAPAKNGIYAVYLQGGYCRDTSDCIAINDVSIYDMTFSGPRVFPNPTKGELTIESGTSRELTQAIIYTFSGQIVLSLDDISMRSIKLNIMELKTGIYFLRISDDSDTSVYRIMKEP